MIEPVTVTISGMDEIDRKLRELGPKLARRTMRKALKAAGEVFVAAQKMRAPVGPGRKTGRSQHPAGNLRDSIRSVTRVSARYEEGAVLAGPTRHAFYAMFQEFGTRHQPSRPFITPAFDESKEAAKDKFIKTLREGLAQAVKE
jgi:HK97 gp10 family phage protein